jgi:hypothetical protein
MPLTVEQTRIFANAIKQINREPGDRIDWLYGLNGDGIPADHWLYHGKWCFGRFFTSGMTKNIPAPANYHVTQPEWAAQPRSYRYNFAVDVDNNTFNILLTFRYPNQGPDLSHEADTNRETVINNCKFWGGEVYKVYFPFNKALDLKIEPGNVIKSINDLFEWENQIFKPVIVDSPDLPPPPLQDPAIPPPPPDVDPVRKQAYDKLMKQAGESLYKNPEKARKLTDEAIRLYPEIHTWYENQKAIKAQQE